VRTITYKNKPPPSWPNSPAVIPHLIGGAKFMESGAVYVQLEVDGREVFDWVEYGLLYDAAGLCQAPG
jgi:hypothetical protein